MQGAATLPRLFSSTHLHIIFSSIHVFCFATHLKIFLQRQIIDNRTQNIH